MWLLILASLAEAGSVRALVEIGPDGAHIVDAVLHPAEVPSQAGPVQVLGEDGRVLATGDLGDPLLRSVIFPEGGGAATRLSAGLARITLPWPAGATRLRVGEAEGVPREATPGEGGVEAVLFSGDSASRLDLVFVSDGYRGFEAEKFAADVDAVVDHLLTLEPYDTYASLMNVWRIFTPSDIQGGSHDGQPDGRTAFDCYYGCGDIDRLICCDDSKVVAAVQAQVPHAEGIMVLVNDETFGGSGGMVVGVAYTGTQGVEVASHELGHSLLGLWDEYSYGIEGDATGAVNCAADPDDTPWEAWRDGDAIDAYAACSYTNAWRPTRTSCLMNTLQYGYCPVCREQAVRAIYRQIGSDLIVSADPPEGEPVRLRKGEHQDFAIELLDTPGHLVTLWWNGSDRFEADEALSLDGPRDGTLVVRVTDDTEWVRSDPRGALIDQVSWDLRDGCGCAGVQGGPGGLLLLFPWILRRRRCSRA